MRFRDVFRAALGNLTRHKVRTLLTTIGVIVGILTIVTMVSLGIGVQKEMREAFDTVGLETVRLRPSTEDVGSYALFGEPQRTHLLTAELITQLANRNGVLSVVPYLRLPRGVRTSLKLDGQEIRTSVWSASAAYIPDPFEIAPRTLAGVERPSEEGGGVVIDSGLLEQLEIEKDEMAALLGREVEIVLYAPRGESHAFRFQIEGIIEREWSNVDVALADRLAMLEWWYDDPDYLAHRGYDELVIRTASLNDAAQLVTWLEGQEYEVESLKMLLDMANRGMIIIQTMLGSVGGVALLVASIGIANTMIMAVYERTKEIGILKAVGAAPGQIRALFVIEASLIGLLGGIAGTILGWLLGKGLNWLILEIFHWQEVPVQGTFFVISWWLVAGALAFATLVGLLAGLYPAARAARLAPLDALRYE
ncbi:MAG: ABC transporter permease [Anaerolineae bacterium]|jgi:ABC-type antimicrobial peptide transport system permease subunit